MFGLVLSISVFCIWILIKKVVATNNTRMARMTLTSWILRSVRVLPCDDSHACLGSEIHRFRFTGKCTVATDVILCIALVSTYSNRK